MNMVLKDTTMEIILTTNYSSKKMDRAPARTIAMTIAIATEKSTSLT